MLSHIPSFKLQSVEFQMVQCTFEKVYNGGHFALCDDHIGLRSQLMLVCSS